MARSPFRDLLLALYRAGAVLAPAPL